MTDNEQTDEMTQEEKAAEFQRKFEEAVNTTFSHLVMHDYPTSDRILYILPSGKMKVTSKGARTIRKTKLKKEDDEGNVYYEDYESPPKKVDIKKPLYFVVDGNKNTMHLTWKQAKKHFSPRQARRAVKRTRHMVRGYEDKKNEPGTMDEIVADLKRLASSHPIPSASIRDEDG